MAYDAQLTGPHRCGLLNFRLVADSLSRVEQVLGVAMPVASGLASTKDDISVFGLGPNEWLVRVPISDEAVWVERLRAATASEFSAVTLVSDAYCLYTIEGADAMDVLAQATGIDVHGSVFPTGSATRAAFAKISALIHRVDAQGRFDLYFDSALTRYAGCWLQSAIGLHGDG